MNPVRKEKLLVSIFSGCTIGMWASAVHIGLTQGIWIGLLLGAFAFFMTALASAAFLPIPSWKSKSILEKESLWFAEQARKFTFSEETE